MATQQPQTSCLVKTLSKQLQEQKFWVQTLTKATLQPPFQLKEQPFWLVHQLEWMQAWLSPRHPVEAVAVPGWLQLSAPAWSWKLSSHQPKSSWAYRESSEVQGTKARLFWRKYWRHWPCEHWTSHHSVKSKDRISQHPPKLSGLGASQITHTYL